jgi:hypothetical protein
MQPVGMGIVIQERGGGIRRTARQLQRGVRHSDQWWRGQLDDAVRRGTRW